MLSSNDTETNRTTRNQKGGIVTIISGNGNIYTEEVLLAVYEYEMAIRNLTVEHNGRIYSSADVLTNPVSGKYRVYSPWSLWNYDVPFVGKGYSSLIFSMIFTKNMESQMRSSCGIDWMILGNPWKQFFQVRACHQAFFFYN